MTKAEITSETSQLLQRGSRKIMKRTPTAKRAISAMLIFLLMAGLYGAIVALCNQYLREHDMLTRSSKFILGVFMFAGFYFIYKWFFSS